MAYFSCIKVRAVLRLILYWYQSKFVLYAHDYFVCQQIRLLLAERKSCFQYLCTQGICAETTSDLLNWAHLLFWLSNVIVPPCVNLTDKNIAARTKHFKIIFYENKTAIFRITHLFTWFTGYRFGARFQCRIQITKFEKMIEQACVKLCHQGKIFLSIYLRGMIPGHYFGDAKFGSLVNLQFGTRT